MRVLQVHCRYREPGGEDMVVEAEAELLRSAGHEVFEYQVSNPEEAIPAAGNLAFSPWNPMRTREVRRLARDLHPDVAHVHNTWFSISPAVLRTLKEEGVRTVVTLHNYRLVCTNGMLFRDGRVCTDCLGRGPWRGVAHRCYRGSAWASLAAAATISLHRRLETWTETVDALLVLTDFQKRLLVEAGFPAERLFVHSNFVPDPGPRPAPPSASRTVLFVGRLSPEKGVELLLDAWEKAQPDGLELIIVGDGPLRQALQQRDVPAVRLAGRLSPHEVSALMLSSRALVFPSLLFEGQPRVVLEAAAAGLPVLATAGSAASQVAAVAGEEWVCKPTMDDLAAALSSLPANASRADAASPLLRQAYDSNYSSPAAIARLTSFLAEAPLA